MLNEQHVSRKEAIKQQHTKQIEVILAIVVGRLALSRRAMRIRVLPAEWLNSGFSISPIRASPAQQRLYSKTSSF